LIEFAPPRQLNRSTLNLTMKPIFLLALLFLLPPGSKATTTEVAPDVFWFDTYGDIRWEDEKARLDNFVIQLFNEPNYTGYIYIYVGRHSCRDEAVARAIRARRYLLNVRHLPWNRLAWRDLGYADDFQVRLWLFPTGAPPRYVPEYQPATSVHVIEDCTSQSRRAKISTRRTNRWTRAAGACFATSLVRRRVL